MSSEFTQSDGEDNKPVIKKRHVLLTLYLALMSLYLFGTIGSYSIGLITGKDPISEVLSINPPLFLGPALMTCVLIFFHITDLVAIAAFFRTSIAIVKIVCAFVDVTTGISITYESIVTVTNEKTLGIATLGIGVTIVRTCAFVIINAIFAVLNIATVTSTIIRPLSISTSSIIATNVTLGSTFVNISTYSIITFPRITAFTVTGE